VQRDEVSGNHEKDVDADIAAGHAAGPQVVENNNKDGNSPQTLDLGLETGLGAGGPAGRIRRWFWRYEGSGRGHNESVYRVVT
jgi:hypothetical protein